MAEERIDLSRFINKMGGKADKAQEERIEIPAVLESVLRYCLKDASERMMKGEQVLPFSALAVGETLFMEEHPGDEVADCFHSARKTVENAQGARAYGFCYDGFIEAGQPVTKHDCLIVEGGCPGEPYGHAIGLLYSVNEDGTCAFADEPIYVSSALNYMSTLDPVEPEAEADGAEAEAAAEEPAE